MVVCDLCARAAVGASLSGGTVRLDGDTINSDHSWARTLRESEVCPARVCKAAADRAHEAELVILRDLLVSSPARTLARDIIAWLCDLESTAVWTAAEVEVEAVSQLYLVTIRRYLAHLDDKSKREAEQRVAKRSQDERVAKLAGDIATKQRSRR